MMYGLQTRVSKEINHKIVKQVLKRDKSKQLNLKIKEFDIVKKTISSFLNKNYSFVSYVHGGFKDIHEDSLKYSIPLLNHDENCFICRSNRKKEPKRGFFAKLFNSPSMKPVKVNKLSKSKTLDEKDFNLMSN